MVGGTSLGANVSLELAARHRVAAPRPLFIEMPVLDNALVAAGLIFLPILLRLRVAKPLLRARSRSPTRSALQLPGRHLPRLDRAYPAASRRCSRGSCSRTAPHREERQLMRRAGARIGGRPLHPFTDSDMLVDELPAGAARERRVDLRVAGNPGRLDDELAAFIAEVYAAEQAESAAGAAA